MKSSVGIMIIISCLFITSCAVGAMLCMSMSNNLRYGCLLPISLIAGGLLIYTLNQTPK